MDTLLQIGLSNAVVAAVLALIVACVGLVWRRPALLHCLWLLVLLKLVTPPLVWVPIEWPTRAAPPVAETVASPGENTSPPNVSATVVEDPTGPFAVETIPGTDEPRIVVTATPAASEEVEPPAPAPATPAPAAPSWLADWWQAAVIGVWLAGSALWFWCAARRLGKFQRLLRHARLAPVPVQKQTEKLARKLGMKHAPPVYLVHGRVSPLLWAVLSAPRLVLPAALLEQVDDEQRATLILHELAHLRRRDHWVRALEFLAMGLYWWHPIVWFARRELHEAEEQCCDAWVVSSLPQANRTYATALVETIEFLSAVRSPVPLMASGVGPIADLKRRLTMIMRGTTPRTLSWRGLLLVVGLGAFLLPLLPSFAWAQDKKEPTAEKSADLERTYRELLNQYTDAVAGGHDEAELNKLQAQLEMKLKEVQDAEAKIRELREKLGQVEGRQVRAREVLATYYRLQLKGAKDGDQQEIILRKVNGKWEIVDPKTVVGEKIETITVPYRIRVNPEAQPKLAPGSPAPTKADPDRRLDDLEKKLEKIMRQIEEMQKEITIRRAVLDRGFFPEKDPPVVPRVIDPGFVPPSARIPALPPGPPVVPPAIDPGFDPSSNRIPALPRRPGSPEPAPTVPKPLLP